MKKTDHKPGFAGAISEDVKDLARNAFIGTTDFVFDVVDFFEAASVNETHKWLSKSNRKTGPLLIAGGLALGAFGLKGAAAIGGAKAVGAGVVALKAGVILGFRGLRAIRPRKAA